MMRVSIRSVTKRIMGAARQNYFTKKLVTVVLALVITVPFTTGCWDRIEIEQRATILGLAIDLPTQQLENEPLDVTHPPDDKVKPKVMITAHIAVPGRIPLGATAGGGSGGDSQKAIWTVNAVGEDVNDALTNLQQQVAERIFLGHLRVIIVSEDYARQGLTTLNDYFRRNPQIRRTTWLMVSKGRAEDIMYMEPPLERVPTLYLLATMDRAKDSGKLPNDFVGRFWTLVSSDGQEGFLPYVSIEQENNLKIDGLAYFNSSRLVGTTTAFQILALMQIKGENPAGYNIPIKVDDSTVVVTAFRRLARMHVDLVNGQPVARVSMHVDANLSENDNPYFDLQDPQAIADIRNQTTAFMEKGAESLIAQTQKGKSDIFGFGEVLRAKHPQYWQRVIKNKQGWEKMYPNLKVEVHATCRIHRMGMKSQ